jgi:hypothetical protein
VRALRQKHISKIKKLLFLPYLQPFLAKTNREIWLKSRFFCQKLPKIEICFLFITYTYILFLPYFPFLAKTIREIWLKSRFFGLKWPKIEILTPKKVKKPKNENNLNKN